MRTILKRKWVRSHFMAILHAECVWNQKVMANKRGRLVVVVVVVVVARESGDFGIFELG